MEAEKRTKFGVMQSLSANTESPIRPTQLFSRARKASVQHVNVQSEWNEREEKLSISTMTIRTA